jgi:predicted phosphodiesterase
MKTIAVVSDTHGNRELMDRIIAFIQGHHGSDTVFHLGDSYTDGLYMNENMDIECRTVPGIYCDAYEDPEVPNIMEEDLFGKKCAFVHDISDCSVTDYDVVFHRHTHIPSFKMEDGTFVINPGHLKEHVSKGMAYSYIILTYNGAFIECEWYHPDQTPILCRREQVE